MIRTLHTCLLCEVQWLGTDPCFVCGEPGADHRSVNLSLAMAFADAERSGDAE